MTEDGAPGEGLGTLSPPYRDEALTKGGGLHEQGGSFPVFGRRVSNDLNGFCQASLSLVCGLVWTLPGQS